MSRCQVDLGFYRPDREYRSGEKVHGWVRIVVDQAVMCRDLKLKAFWETDGKGNRSRTNYFQATLFRGHWKKGETYEYQFEFELPDFPLTYHGRNLSVDHHVSVRAEIPWPVDAFCFRDILVRPGIKVVSHATDPLPTELHGLVWNRFRKWTAMLLFFLGAVFAFWTKGISLIGCIFGLWLFYVSAGPLITARRLGYPRVGFTSDYIVPLANSEILLRLDPPKAVSLRHVSIQVTAFEIVVTKNRQQQAVLSHSIHSQSVAVEFPKKLSPGKQEILCGPFSIPDTNAYTLDLPDNQIKWQANVTVRTAFWPELQLTQPFRLMPPQPIDQVNPTFAKNSSGSLIELIRHLIEGEASKAESVVEQYGDRVFELDVMVDRVCETTYTSDDPEYVSGRTIYGQVGGGMYDIAISLPAQYNGQMDEMARGDSWHGQGAVVKWHAGEQRIEFIGI